MEVEYLSEAESIGSDAGHFRGKHVSTSKDKKDETSTRAMIIHLFGTTPEGKSVRVEVNGFCPFFYVALPPTTTPTEESRFKIKLQEAICAKIPKSISNTIKFELVRKQKLIGFTGGQIFPFLKISVPSLGSFYELRKLFLDDRQIPKFRLPQAGSKPLEIFESNIDPMLRFFHIRDLQPCGWACVKGLELESADDTIQLRADWDSISPSVSSVVTAPFKHAFWDIECYSHDKEFPVAQQGYRRVAKQLWQGGYDVSAMPGLLEEGFAASAAKADSAASAKAVKIPPLKNPKLAPRAKEISAIVTAPKFVERLKEIWDGRDGLLVKQKAERLASLTKFLDSCFARLAPIAGDPIIQIGTVSVSGRGGNQKESHIFVLGGCAELSSIPDAHVHVFKTEKELLLGWFNWLIEENFDIFSGYNIFGFDERYVWERLIELGLEQEECVQRMTRLWDEGGEMKLQEKFLSSSALGDNMLYMWNTPGRLRIDLYSHIKRKVQLTSYKLDSVCAAFLSGKLGGISAYGSEGQGRWLLKTKQRGDARLGRYVQVLNELGEDLSDKMKIVEITGDGIVVESEEELIAVAGEAVKWAIVKDDVSPQELFRLHREGGDIGRARIAAYCIQDCDLVYELYKKLDVFNEAMSMANVCSVPVSYIFTRGQGIKIESLIFKDCMLKDQLIVVQPAAVFGAAGAAAEGQAQEDSYEGAIVLDPVPGFYTEAPIGVCDFASLYPSTIISENISHDMLVWTKDYDMNGKLVCVKYGSEEAERFAPPGTRWTDIEFDILRPDPNDTHKNPKKTKQGTRICRYAQLAGNKKGSLPQIVGKLLAARKAKRAEITKTDDPFKKALLDAEQNAYKITANSLYGQLGSRTFKIRLQDLAASVTAYARKQIMFSKDAIEEFYGPAAGRKDCNASEAKVVYGDSVTGDTPLFLKGVDTPYIQRIDALAGEWLHWHESKEAIDIQGRGLLTWTDKGWTEIRRIIRHRLQPGKKLYRILTHTGVVDCTEDHSLVADSGEAVKPGEVSIGSSLLHHSVFGEFGSGKGVPSAKEAKEAWAMGFFLADGSADVYDCPSGSKATWAINKADTSLLEKVADKLPFDTKILDTLESSGVYKLVPVGVIKEHALRYRELFYNTSREKRIPSCILNAPIEIVKEFMEGFYAGDGDKANGHGYTRWDQKGKEVSSGLWILSQRLGFKASLNDRGDKEDVFCMTLTDWYQQKSRTAIKKIRELSSEGVEYVYDLETENHHFAVGPGNLIVHNTDSLFVCFNPRNPETGERLQGREAIVKTIELTEEAGHFITQALRAPHDFEYDKVFSPFIIFSKKRYVGNKYEDSPDDFKETSMGIVLKRRDNAPLLKMIYGGAIDKLLNSRDIAGATAFVQEKVRDLVDGHMKLSQLTITKALAADYEGTPPAHKMLADRITARDPGNAPASGDRVGFVYVQPEVGQKAGKLQGDRIETPQYIEENGLKPDTEYYIEHQLNNPLSQLFGILLEKMPGFAPPMKWSDNPDKLITQRELMAGEILFRRALQQCQKFATANFITKNFGSVAAVAKRQPLQPRQSASVLPASLQAVAPKKQSSLDLFIKQTAIMTDTLLARDMRAARAAKREKKKE